MFIKILVHINFYDYYEHVLKQSLGFDIYSVKKLIFFCFLFFLFLQVTFGSGFTAFTSLLVLDL